MNTWKRWPCWSVKAILCAAPGWGRSRRQIARVPSGQPERASSRLASSAAPALWRGGGAVLVQGGLPCLLGQGQDRLADRLGEVQPDRKPQLATHDVGHKGVGGAGGGGPPQDRRGGGGGGRPPRGH